MWCRGKTICAGRERAAVAADVGSRHDRGSPTVARRAAGRAVLEVGTGSGYSTALLACLVGSGGQVVSIDVDASLVERSARLLRADALAQVQVLHRDGRLGYASAAPYDRVVAWATVEELPIAWTEQLTLSGVVVAPVQLLPLAHAVAVARLRVLENSGLLGDAVIVGSFVPVTDAPLQVWPQPPALADVIMANGWLSARWLRGTNIEDHVCDRVQQLILGPTPLDRDEPVQAFRAYLLTEAPPRDHDRTGSTAWPRVRLWPAGQSRSAGIKWSRLRRGRRLSRRRRAAKLAGCLASSWPTRFRATPPDARARATRLDDPPHIQTRVARLAN